MSRRDPRPRPGDRFASIHDQLTAAVAELAGSDAWRRMLAVAARFPRYSPSNMLLIAVQRPDATRVTGLRTWNSLGRRVRKGEKGSPSSPPACTERAAIPRPPTRPRGRVAQKG